MAAMPSKALFRMRSWYQRADTLTMGHSKSVARIMTIGPYSCPPPSIITGLCASREDSNEAQSGASHTLELPQCAYFTYCMVLESGIVWLSFQIDAAYKVKTWCRYDRETRWTLLAIYQWINNAKILYFLLLFTGKSWKNFRTNNRVGGDLGRRDACEVLNRQWNPHKSILNVMFTDGMAHCITKYNIDSTFSGFAPDEWIEKPWWRHPMETFSA